jgi:hypothetical protein
MNAWLRRLGGIADKAISVLVWLHESIMLFLCLFWLLPLLVLVVISAFIYDLRPLLRVHAVLLYSLLGLPLWFGVCLYAEVAATAMSRRIKEWMGRLPVYVGYVLLSVGGLLWLLGII